MPRLYEEAATLLYYVVSAGLVLNSLVDPRRIITVLAETLEAASSRSHTHAEAAIMVLDTLKTHWLAHYDPTKRNRLIAMIGTFIGNTPSLQTRH